MRRGSPLTERSSRPITWRSGGQGLLHRVLLEEAPDDFVFADIACGTAPGSAEALRDTRIARYIGIGISRPSLDVAREALSALSCPVELRCQDYVDAIDAWTGRLDVLWIGQSLHHLQAEQKAAFMKKIQALIPRNGLVLIWEPTCFEGEDRNGWMERFRGMRPNWPLISDEEFAAFDAHHRASDYGRLRRRGWGWPMRLGSRKPTSF